MATSKHPNLASALIAAQQAFAPITKDNTITQSGVSKQGKAYNLTYKYADLGSVLEAVTPALHENGLAISQCMANPETGPVIVTHLLHADSTDTLTSYTPIIWADKTDPQKFGGGITYSRRYALMAMLNLNAEDDDGNHAREPRPQPRREPEASADPVTGEIDETAEKNAVMRHIMALAKDLGYTNEQVKEEMWVAYGGNTPEDAFSRTQLTLDQMNEYRERLVERKKKKGAAK